MATKKDGTTKDGPTKKPEQAALIPLSAEELAAAPKKLAGLIDTLDELEREHKEIRAEQGKERKKVQGQIRALASQIRTQGR